MQVYDIIMLIVLLTTTFIGFRKGLAWQIASVAAIVVSYIVAIQFRDVVAARINTAPPWNTFLAMLILYVGTSFAIWVLFQMVRGGIDRSKLEGFDQQLGALLGLGKGVLLCVIITFFAVTLLGDSQRQTIIQSRSGYYIAQLIDQADTVMPAELHDFLHPYLQRLDEGLDGAQSQPSGLERIEQGVEQGLERLEDLRRVEDWLENPTDEDSTMFGDDQPSRDSSWSNGGGDRQDERSEDFYVDPNFGRAAPSERVADPYYRPTPR